MREILFRAKRIDNGEWAEGYLFDDGMAEVEHYFVGRIVVEPYKGTACDDWDITGIDFCEVNPETLCQYTGLKDKNGNQIWENDIVDASEEWRSACGPAGHNSPIIKVEWLEGLTGFDPFANYDCDCGVYIDANGCEVIGNIFDNPELLKGE